MNDNTNEQPQGAEISSTAANASVAEKTATPSSPASGNAPAARRVERRERPGKASLADASGADALMALARQMRLARGEPEELEAPASDDVSAAEPRQQREAQQRRPVRAKGQGAGNNSRPAANKARGSNRPDGASRAPSRQGAPAGGASNADAQPARTPRPLHPVLVQLGQLYPKVFGEQPLPLKRGIYQDLVAAHPADLDAAGLKVALGLHTRSYRYLNVVSQGVARHDLQGAQVEAMAPEHVHHALLEVFRRRKPRDGEDMALKLRRRIAIAFDASGLTRESYDALVRGRKAEANVALDDAMAEVAERDAKAEALRQAFEASGKDEASFAEMYGVRPQVVQQAIKRCAQIAQRKVREVAAVATVSDETAARVVPDEADPTAD